MQPMQQDVAFSDAQGLALSRLDRCALSFMGPSFSGVKHRRKTVAPTSAAQMRRK